MAKIIILNGPPRCGKDTAAEAVMQHFTSDLVSHHKLSEPLKQIVSSITGQEHAALEAIKDEHRVFSGSYRDLQIGTFQALSQVFSPQWLGEVLAHKLAADQNDNIVVSDGGCMEDVLPLFRRGHKLMIVQILRNGCHFGHDIRGYISNPRADMKTILNDNKAVFEASIVDLAAEFYANG